MEDGDASPFDPKTGLNFLSFSISKSNKAALSVGLGNFSDFMIRTFLAESDLGANSYDPRTFLNFSTSCFNNFKLASMILLFMLYLRTERLV